MSFIENVANAVPSATSLSDAERRAVVEIAYLAVASDHVVNEHEEKALRSVAAKIGGADLVDPILAKARRLDRESADARLRELAKALPTYEARVLAYKAAYAVAIADLASSDQEFEFDLQLIDALELPQSEVDRFAEDVMHAIQPKD